MKSRNQTIPANLSDSSSKKSDDGLTPYQRWYRKGGKEYQKEWRRKNPEKALAAQKRYRDKNSIARKAWHVQYSLKPEVKDRRREYIRNSDKELKQQVFEAYGCICKCCGETGHVFLTIDHVHNNGAEERRRIKSYRSLLYSIINRGFPDDYQILCFNCNRAKHVLGVCPHQKEMAS